VSLHPTPFVHSCGQTEASRMNANRKDWLSFMKKRFNRRRFLELSAGATIVAAGLGPLTAHTQNAVSTSIALNGSGSGRTFDGIGAISGGGGVNTNIKLVNLYNYSGGRRRHCFGKESGYIGLRGGMSRKQVKGLCCKK